MKPARTVSYPRRRSSRGDTSIRSMLYAPCAPSLRMGRPTSTRHPVGRVGNRARKLRRRNRTRTMIQPIHRWQKACNYSDFRGLSGIVRDQHSLHAIKLRSYFVPLRLVDLCDTSTKIDALRSRYRFIDWTKVCTFFDGFNDDVIAALGLNSRLSCHGVTAPTRGVRQRRGHSACEARARLPVSDGSPARLAPRRC
jgi:hypothetical protein